MKMFYEKDADVNLIKSKKVAIFGYGSQGHAHVANLKDSGVNNINVALKENSLSVSKAKSAGFNVISIEEASKESDVLMLATPDEIQGKLYKEKFI